jgi:uncharacterized repeat protein (TIGR01451 family)
MKICFVILLIIILSAHLATAIAPNPEDPNWWSSAVSGTLYKGDTLSNGEYMVKAVQFPSGVPGIQDINNNIVPEYDVDPMVYLEIYKNGILLKEIILTLTGGPYIDPDNEVKISATDFLPKNAKEWVLEYYKPWATIGIQLRAKPKLEVTVSTIEKTTYTSNSDQIMTAQVTITNSGDGYAKNVEANLNIGELNLRSGFAGQLHQYYYEMGSGTSQTFDVILIVPDLINEKSYNLSATAIFQDVKGLAYNATGSISVTVSPEQNYFTISKAVRNRIYLQDITLVTITVDNGGMYDITDIHISDNMNENFELKSKTAFNWNVSLLKPGQEWSTVYSIKPLEANLNGFTIPAASATFKVNDRSYSASTQTNTVIVNGPKIIMNKTVDKSVVNISEAVTVTVSIKNAGDIGSKIEVKDYLPDGASLVSGMISMDNYSDPGSNLGFSYIIRMNNVGKYELPPAVANYTDIKYRGTTRDAKSSDRPIVTVVDPKKVIHTANGTEDPVKTSNGDPKQIPSSGGKYLAPNTIGTPLPTSTLMTPGFEIVLALFVLIAVAVIMPK